jgi:hypothetical protein
MWAGSARRTTFINKGLVKREQNNKSQRNSILLWCDSTSVSVYCIRSRAEYDVDVDGPHSAFGLFFFGALKSEKRSDFWLDKKRNWPIRLAKYS